MVPVALGAAGVAAVGGMAVGVRYAPDYPGGHWATVATRMPTGAPVYVKPECTLTLGNAFESATGSAPVRIGRGGPIPAGFTPVRAVRCGVYGDSSSETATQSEVRDPGALKAMVAAYRTTHVREHVGDQPVFCPAIAELDPIVALVDAHGVAIVPGAPRDACDFIVPAVISATRDAVWTVTKSVTVHG
ncbi:hypothetical protein [Catenulispora pinisilvae]|uniref:hypothetical protein n=1 Tax=Catenulispora pinisilvae TaxID=2705253 RepID=UPI001891A8B8|nr:hypothetical protein [Catenulispora pinisilvae]